MSEAVAARFSCDGCNRTYAWKEQLAGRRVKCKCGQVMTVPQTIVEPDIDPNALYDLVADEPSETPVKLAPLASPVKAAPASAGKGKGAAAAAGGAHPLGYQLGQTQREKDRFSKQALMDMKRDVYVPAALVVVGLILYVLSYAIPYHMSGAGIALTAVGLAIMTVFKAVLLIGFAFVVAGPLGVSFGGIWTAVLKLAAIAVFCDGVTAWIDLGVQKLGGGGGFFGYGMLAWPIAFAIYWGMLIYLFSMDQEDSWTVVMLLSVFDYIARWIIIALLLAMVMNWGGVALPAGTPTFGGGSGSSKLADPQAARIEELKEFKLLREAREYIAGGRQEILKGSVDALYAAGCKNVWFEVTKDLLNQKASPVQVIVEMPKDPKKRAECITIIKDYYQRAGMSDSSEDLEDDGGLYVFVGISG